MTAAPSISITEVYLKVAVEYETSTLGVNKGRGGLMSKMLVYGFTLEVYYFLKVDVQVWFKHIIFNVNSGISFD